MPALLAPHRRDLTPAPPAPIDDVTRRDLLRGTGVLSLATLLGGCADGSDGDVGASPTEGARTIPHRRGELTLTGVPDRIVTILDRVEFECLLTLGVTPAATGVLDGEAPWQADLDRDGIETFPGLQTFGVEFDIEQLAALDADVLIGPDSVEEPDLDLLAQATTLFVTGAMLPGPFGWWETVLEQMAAIVDRSDRVAGIVADVNAALDRVADRIAELGLREVSLFSVYEAGPYLFSDFNAQGALLERLGLSRPAGQRERFQDPQGRGGYDLSVERLDELDTDLLLLMDYVPEATDDLEALELFQRLPAVTQGRYVRLPSDVAAAMFFHSPVSLPWVADRLLDLLTDVSPR